MKKEPWIVFFAPDGKELAAYTVRGTFADELESTIGLLAYENGLEEKDITYKVINR